MKLMLTFMAVKRLRMTLLGNHFRMNNSEKRDSDSRAKKQRVAATQGAVQPRPNASATQTAAGGIAETISSRAQGGSQRDKNVKGISRPATRPVILETYLDSPDKMSILAECCSSSSSSISRSRKGSGWPRRSWWSLVRRGSSVQIE
jgi:hypothetical protein